MNDISELQFVSHLAHLVPHLIISTILLMATASEFIVIAFPLGPTNIFNNIVC